MQYQKCLFTVDSSCRPSGALLICIIVGQGHTVLAVCAGGAYLEIFSRLSYLSSFSLSLWEAARYRLKKCLKGPLNPKQLTNQSFFRFSDRLIWRLILELNSYFFWTGFYFEHYDKRHLLSPISSVLYTEHNL